jgi:hypothetical protein
MSILVKSKCDVVKELEKKEIPMNKLKDLLYNQASLYMVTYYKKPTCCNLLIAASSLEVYAYRIRYQKHQIV